MRTLPDMREAGGRLGAPARPAKIKLPSGRPPVVARAVWDRMDWPSRLQTLRDAAQRGGESNIMRTFVTNSILRRAGVQPREYVDHARAIHQWAVENLYYINESGEYIQDPLDTVEHRIGDCDDMSLFLAAAALSIGLTAKFQLAGYYPDGSRWVSDTGVGMPADPSHVFIYLGTPPDCAPDAEGNVACSIVFQEADATASWIPFGATSYRVTTTAKDARSYLAGVPATSPGRGYAFFLLVALALCAVGLFYRKR